MQSSSFLNEILQGDSSEILKTVESDSIDLLVTDPPYGYSFMNKDWDKAVVSTDVWKECLRVLKPGAFAFIMSSPRQDVLCKMILNLIDAGFETNFTSLYHTYASGFPKAKNLRNGSFVGYQPKPAVEVILVVMKPLSQKSYTDQALNNGKGITWLSECRIDKRFPANLLVSDDVLNDGKNYKSGGKQGNLRGENNNVYSRAGATLGKPCIMMDKSEGSFSRYFSLDSWVEKTLPFLIVAKASKSERNKGCENVYFSKGNTHVAVKPLKLMSYLITMGSRLNDIVLDPFCGSGTTCIAAAQLGRRYIGIEKEAEYVKIAETRLKPYTEQQKIVTY